MSSFLDTTIGVIMVGMTVTASLFGVTSGQVMWYFRHYPRDRTSLKVMVCAIWALDTTSLALYFASMWQYLVDKNLVSFGGDPLPWTSNAQIIINACSIAIIQSFYMFRIWTLSKSYILASMLGLFVAADLALGILLCVKSIQTKALSEFSKLTPFDIAMSTMTATTDMVLCGSLVTLLARSRTGSTGSDRLINKLLFYTINSGLLTTFCSVLSLITVIVLPDTSVYVMFYYIGSRMYSISLLSTLNAREGLRNSAEKFGHNSLPNLTSSHSLSRRSHENSRKGTTSQPGPSREIVVAIQRDTTVTFEEHTAREAAFMKPSKYRLKSQALKKPASPSPRTSAHDSKLSPESFMVVTS
ncbi:hypothetical protein L226DRAFT_571006 [Lentinus tigrinus ALCF2SS1-7]|uniref:DUF6534 domain-containing protein n=1 Tax=Lentinus tigrinus ALCF2SS1-6 TaxID=1328759 RepID=A0A5C2S9S2_9APHY|nr:hypothetical protein L227DRAFT_653503 [Lentinus tigrinus ALCF2SS1-6]RPD74710.1 hypothetical protein L226DRAFT_571006 [Lentinus tigrinus ALCF2SS1-7]